MAICHARHPRRTGTRIRDRGDHCSDLSDQHFRSERARHPQRLRLLEDRQSDAHRAPDGARELGVGRILPRFLLRYGRGDHCDAPVQKGRSRRLLARRLRRHLPALQRGVAKLRAHIFLRRNFQRQRNRARHDSAHPACLDRVADQPASPDYRHQSGGENRPSATALSVWSTTPSRRRFSSGPSSSAPISSFTRRQNTWRDTRTSSGERSVSMNPHSTSGSSSCKMPRARRLLPSIVFSRFEG